MPDLDARYWADRYRTGDAPWDIGQASAPLQAYFDQLDRKDLRILIPGGGRAYEAEHLHRHGFTQVFVIDLTDAPFQDLLRRCPDFPQDHLIEGDFFAHDAAYDRIIEQTFLSALDPGLRPRYVRKMHALLRPGGRLVGVLFNDPLNTDKPPFGGSEAEYRTLFGSVFTDLVLAPCTNSIPQRAGRELWLRATRTATDHVPVDCSRYDRYEAWATLRTPLRIEHVDATGAIVRSNGRIADLRTDRTDRTEWMDLDTGLTIRLDRIRSVDPAEENADRP